MAKIDFDVTIRDKHLGPLTLMVDHAPHREENQNNVTTVLAWGSTINHSLAEKSHIDDWVLIERDTGGRFKLTIQKEKPADAP